MSESVVIPVILAGGSGTRLWPLSRSLYPKQLLPLVNERTLLQNTVSRLAGVSDAVAPLVICNTEHRFLVAEQLREVDKNAAILLEPAGRNTAPAVAVAALEALTQEDDPVLLVLPADHLIDDEAVFGRVLVEGLTCAERGDLITFGITPHQPEIGYGYICKGEQAEGVEDVYRVASFVEKPDLDTAKGYLQSGEYLWNSGMFMFKARRYLEELEKFAPEMLAACRAAHAGKIEDLDFIRLDDEAFCRCPSDSIDYAVMEKTDAACVIPLDCGWSDIGSWAALWERGEQD
ncbi:MAG: mannose-1-phosphate guanylyltransferase/mannose-6-phosphate isomerase, partial [Desulfobulbaceae bacterium]|nr:mannose-1-phosphate guanylyltransferase/mannose-6-phosphate isomerase [Desulfobulbaceae bacterium]